ncbi:MAG: carboxypeptidase regulatory-like domain-containing protein, partial [Bacteroidetes bacterium]|nr:carboxypeptidase regulatory-like domain-containing protein [Bacteroidota bacterium]
MRIFYSLILIIFTCTRFLAQTPETYQLPIEGKITDDGEAPIPGASIQVYQGSKLINTYTTGADGKYSFQLPLNGDYNIVVTKGGDMVQKKFMVSTRGIPPERATSKFSSIQANIGLFRKVEGVDYSVLNQPLNKYVYNPDKSDFEYDKAYLEQMLGALEHLRELEDQALNKKKEIEKNYQAAVKAGDKAFQKKDWAGAKASYNQALTIKPTEYYPKDQITQIDKLIAEQEALNKKNQEDAKKAAEEAARKKAEEDLSNKYLAALKKGDDAFAKKDWASAKAGYNEALGVKPTEQLPKDKLAAIDKLLADEAAAKAKAEADAKAKADAEAAAKAKAEAD